MEIFKKEFDTKVYNRCTYVIEENERLEKFCEALEKNDNNKINI